MWRRFSKKTPASQPRKNPNPNGAARRLDFCVGFTQGLPVAILTGRVIVIIGGTSGLGLSAARAFQSAGAQLVVTGRDDDYLAQAQNALGGEVIIQAADASTPGTAEAAIHLARQQFGQFDGLYHVAGGSGRGHGDGPLDLLTDEGWDYTLRTNLTSVFLSNRAAVRQFLADGNGGALLNVSSALAYSPSPAHFATHAYATAKAGIIALSHAMAATYASSNIRCNVLAPGLIATPMSRRAQENPEIQQFIRVKQPLDGGRMGAPHDCDGAAVFLLSDAARFITGQVLAVDGGWSVSEGGSSVVRA